VDTQTDRQDGDLISLLLFFLNKGNRLKNKFWEELIACFALIQERIENDASNNSLLPQERVYIQRDRQTDGSDL
jgi:hypothetical protein